jgi:Asp-tRNA(Asn)/Glu-tRNA(Gln) amidotransferase A subunit family amidase
VSQANELSAHEAARRMAAGELTSVELVKDCLARIEARDGDVRAWEYIDPAYALEQAKAADAERATGKSVGPLHGVPVGIKDIIDTADMPTENGSAMFRGRRTNQDATCVARLRAVGAVILGKTVTTELANIAASKTRNPHNLAFSPGGSSAGSGAAVADFQVPLALGTQTGGSVIRPASFNGVYGFKPTLGMIPRAGVLLQSHTLDTVGVYGRTMEDVGLVSDVLSAVEPNDPWSYRGSRGRLSDMLGEAPPAAPTFAFLETPAWDHAEEDAKAAIQGVAQQLGAQCRQEALAAPFDEIIELHGTVMGAEDLAYYGGFLEKTPELLSPQITDRLEKAKSIRADRYVDALIKRDVINRLVDNLLDRYDAILCLASAGPAPEGFETTGSAIFNGLWTYLGVPCVSLPRLQVRGMPMGVQLVGMRGDDGRLLRTANWLDEFLAG